MSKLRAKQECFCQEYVIDLNASQAALRAGYSAKTAGAQGHDLLKKPEIRKRVEELQARKAERVSVTADMVINRLAEIAFADPSGLYNKSGGYKKPHEWDKQAALIANDVTIMPMSRGGNRVSKVKKTDQLRALELLGKHFGVFVEKHEITGADGGPLETVMLDPKKYQAVRKAMLEEDDC